MVVPSGLPDEFSLRSNCQGKLLDLTDQIKMPAKVPASMLSRQVSNLNSSDPESDVLPITPRDNFVAQRYSKNSKIKKEKGEFNGAGCWVLGAGWCWVLVMNARILLRIENNY